MARRSVCCTTSSPEIIQNYAVIRALGAGKYGQVKEVQHKGSKQRFAWKQVLSDSSPESEPEVQLLRNLRHQNIIQIHEVYSAPGVVDMVLELCTEGSMKRYMRSRVEKCDGASIYCPPGRHEIARSLFQLLSAVSFLHQNEDNVLLSGRTWKLADFNLACNFGSRTRKVMRSKAGTRPFMAPEVLEKGRSYTEKCDIYSLGVLFIALRTGQHYWHPESCEDEQGAEVARSLLTEERWQGMGRGALPFAVEMISPEADRCDAEEALAKPWLVQQLGGPLVGEVSCCSIS
ncbi:unnamed protein product [Cladocopium goreaui]|uniref:Calcium/calmodulin-dependent protein kinase type II subunit gamma n=1 Tax=Cladocopium goreaui TaxID=2562237 RepID=A0A9P1CFZ0_9DINO|nr:unnamed protein product [Cladocopium goreaui]